ncbi:DUF305 domain-containing protein [Prauserella shujinwangii]|nr:DUF305 domain-containing protein [Prauserella shujinwangii]
MRKTLGFVLSTVAAGAVLTACTGGAGHNDADVEFAQRMIPHHEQAIEMAELVGARTGNARIRDLAADIERAQGPEIERLTTWLSEWGASTGGGQGGHGEHDADHAGMPGMMSSGDLSGLSAASGPEFDRMWLRMMVRHHEGAIEMAREQLDHGEHEGARQLAQAVIDAQQREIDTMNALLTEG